MDKLTHIDLFSGIGGFALACRWAGIETEVFCENDKRCQDFLNRTYQGVPIIPDVREFDGTKWRGRFILTGGFPCQDISVAGKGNGLNGIRSGLWREMFRVIRDARPSYILIENSPALLVRGGVRVLSDLASIGYDAEWQTISANEMGAPHKRTRLYIIAYPNLLHGEKGVGNIFKRASEILRKSTAERTRLWLQTPHPLDRMDDGVSSELYRVVIEMYGNSIVPQVAYEIIKAIREANG